MPLDTFAMGVDEAGRGPLVGPVFAAAVVLPPDFHARPEYAALLGLRDSKALSAKRREQLFDAIAQHAVAFSVASASAAEIDDINILQATLLAMRRAVSGVLQAMPSGSAGRCTVWVDGNKAPDLSLLGVTRPQVHTLVKGDALRPDISAASIVAKVSRDRWCAQAEVDFPGYGFAQHKGYPTQAHLEALQRLGACPLHRRSFAPVRQVLLNV